MKRAVGEKKFYPEILYPPSVLRVNASVDRASVRSAEMLAVLRSCYRCYRVRAEKKEALHELSWSRRYRD